MSFIVSLVRIIRMILLVGCTLGPVHIIVMHANQYTTQQYVTLARAEATKAQYSTPLHDAFFPEEPYCSKQMQDGYDLALWLVGGASILRCIIALLQSPIGGPSNYDVERYAVVFLTHHLIMCSAQVATTLPASGGIEECYAANPPSLRETGVVQWPWFGISFLTQSFAGGRACADMIYSGHTAVAVLSLVCGARVTLKSDFIILYYLVQLTLCAGCFVALVSCHDHYSVDIVLAIPMAVLLCTNLYLDSWARHLATFWRHLEASLASEELTTAHAIEKQD